MKKLLIISVSAGTGHVRAAEAIVRAAKQTRPGLIVRHIDLMDHISLPMKTAVVGSYDLLVRQAPELWGFLYDKTNVPGITKKLKRLGKKLKKINAKKLYEFVKEFRPDYILSTHFLPADLLDKEVAHGTKTGTLITDYDLHELWITSKNQDYFVATEKIAWKLEHQGIERSQINITGIPVDPVFYTRKDKIELCRVHGIHQERPCLLVLSGGEGMAHTDKIVSDLFKLQTLYTIIAVAGKNDRLLAKLERLSAPKNITYMPVGWTDTMDEYMTMADIVISKSGGLTTTECAVLGKPLVAIDPIPGQEEGNARFLLETGRGRIAQNVEDLLYIIECWRPDTGMPLQKTPAAELILKKIEDE